MLLLVYRLDCTLCCCIDHSPRWSLSTRSLKPCDRYLSRDASVKVNVHLTFVRVFDNPKSTHIQRGPDHTVVTKRHVKALALKFQAIIAVEIVFSAVVFSCLVFLVDSGGGHPRGNYTPVSLGQLRDVMNWAVLRQNT